MERKRKLTVADTVKNFTFVSHCNCSTVFLECTKKPDKIKLSLDIDCHTVAREYERNKNGCLTSQDIQGAQKKRILSDNSIYFLMIG